MTANWPDRITDLTPSEKAALLRRDGPRYYEQVWAERIADAHAGREARRRSAPWWLRWLS